MAAPTPTVRQTPTGIMLENGHSSLITILLDPDISFWEIEMTPPGIDGGDEIDVTTMHSDTWRTKAPRTLKDLTESTVTAGYDPLLYTQILAVINRETTITQIWPDGTTLAYYGFVKSFTPNNLVEGEMPQADIVIVPTNRDPSSGAEESPVLTNVAGT
jgi:hypothetical protein